MALGAIVGWSLNFIFARSLVGVIPPFTLGLLRVGVAVIAFAPFAGKACARYWPFIHKRLVFYILLSLAGLGYYNPLVYTAAQTTPAINLALLAMSSPIFTLILSRIFLGEPLTKRRMCGMAAALCGVVLLAVRGNPAALATLSFHTGDGVMLFAAFCFACYSVNLSRVDPEIQGNALLFCILVISFIFLVPLSAWEVASGMPVHFTPKAIIGVLYLGVVASVFCYIGWNGAIVRIGAGNVALLYYTLPLFSGLEATILLGEPLHWFHFVSGALIIIGVLTAARRGGSPRGSATPPHPQYARDNTRR